MKQKNQQHHQIRSNLFRLKSVGHTHTQRKSYEYNICNT